MNTPYSLFFYHLEEVFSGRSSVKQRIAVMLGLKQFRNAAITIAGIELMRVIEENPTNLGEFGLEKPRIQIDFKGKDGKYDAYFSPEPGEGD